MRRQLVPLDIPGTSRERRAESVRARTARRDDDGADAPAVAPTPHGALHDSEARQLAMHPAIEEAMRRLAVDDPVAFDDMLFPVLGPAIRRATRLAIDGLLQRANDARAYSLFRLIRWRIEAWVSGRPFAEVVFQHAMVYQVEQVLLIHRHSGLLLQHVAAASDRPPVRQPDVVSGMVSAIQHFIEDSFRTRDDDGLDTLKIGELTLWIEYGPIASLAAVVRGLAPEEEVRHALQDALMDIHEDQREALRAFAGDTTPFGTTRPRLECCLRAS